VLENSVDVSFDGEIDGGIPEPRLRGQQIRIED